MATKKTPTKKKTSSRAESTAARSSGPTPEDLSQASAQVAALRAEVEVAERELEAARSISTTDHRLPAVAAATEKLAQARASSMEASERLAALKTALSSGNFYRTSALGKRPGKRPASASAKRGEPSR